jgi:8-oxo-dGTP pyrophosphatase MutT (NUDIX family)
MPSDGPAPGEEINQGEATVPRPAASVIVLRDSADGPEVLLVQRNPEQHFMGGAWVFPGGAVHDEDDGGDPAAAGVRELMEEAAIELAREAELIPFVRWITPEQVKTRFDTWFYLAAAPDGQEGKCDGAECVDLRWITPEGALAEHAAERLMLVFPTIRTLQRLTAFDSVEDAMTTARQTETDSIQPRVVQRGDETLVVLPGEPGYDD